MIMYYDPDYQETKRIMLGEESMKAEFRSLADWVDETFGIKTINIVYDTIEEGTRPRLELCFEFEKEKDDFLNREYLNYDGLKQKDIALKFQQTIEAQGLTEQYPTENIWIIFGGFEPIARMEANSIIPQEDIEALKTALDNKDLWEISRAFSGVTFFLYTDQQIKEYENSAVRKLWTDKYFDILEPYNQFGYFKREDFNIYLDSKENFDKNYAGNWYYYYK